MRQARRINRLGPEDARTGGSLEDRVALVTGAGRGIGRGIALALAHAGATLFVNDIVAVKARETSAEIVRQGGRCVALEGDVSRSRDVHRLFGAIRRRDWGLDILVNNAALVWGIQAHLLELSESRWDRVLNVNLRGAFLCAQAAASLMAVRGGGAIINMTSVGALRAHRNNVAYAASKGGVEAATRAMALDLAPYRIRVNAVGPGVCETEQWRTWPPGEAQRQISLVPLQRAGTPEDIGNLVVFLASDFASYITGQIIYVDGGFTSQLRPPTIEPGRVRPSRRPPPQVAERRRRATSVMD